MQARGPLMVEHRLIARMLSVIKDALVQIESSHREGGQSFFPGSSSLFDRFRRPGHAGGVLGIRPEDDSREIRGTGRRAETIKMRTEPVCAGNDLRRA